MMWNKKINELAIKANINREAYIRMLINKVVPPPLVTAELDQVLRQFRKIGTNINQIAYKKLNNYVI